jgi:hypothetical protein
MKNIMNNYFRREYVTSLVIWMLLKSGTREITDTFSAKDEIEGHVLRVSKVMQTSQRKLDSLIDSAGNAQKGVLQPQIISPYSEMEALMKCVPALPRDVVFPFPLSKHSAHLVLRVCNLQVYALNEVLAYAVHVPLVNMGQFDIHKLIPILMLLDKSFYRTAKFLVFVHRPVFWKLENTTFRKMDLFPSSGEGGGGSHLRRWVP